MNFFWNKIQRVCVYFSTTLEGNYENTQRKSLHSRSYYTLKGIGRIGEKTKWETISGNKTQARLPKWRTCVQKIAGQLPLFLIEVWPEMPVVLLSLLYGVSPFGWACWMYSHLVVRQASPVQKMFFTRGGIQRGQLVHFLSLPMSGNNFWK